MDHPKDHTDFADGGFVERYHRGLLAPEEEAEFEAHFVGCAECTEQLELARGFQRGLKTMVAEDVAGQAVVRAVVQAQLQAGLLAWLARRGRLAQWSLALGLLLLAAGVPGLWLWRESGERRRAQEESASLRQEAAGLKKTLAESEKAQGEERKALESRLAALSATDAQGQGPHTGAGNPLVNTPVFLLSTVRGAPGEPAATLDLAKSGDHLVLAVDVDDDPRLAGYRVTLTDTQGKERFRQSNLQRNAFEAVMITFPTSFFTPGDYRLKLEGLPKQGAPVAVGSYPFRVVSGH
jgi:hypothetical protein